MEMGGVWWNECFTFRRMRFHMCHQASMLRVTFPTHVTFKRLLTTVRPHVLIQPGQLRKALATLQTVERFLSGV